MAREQTATVCVPVAERFVSLNGEGARAGQLAAFIRLSGCNLNCAWCDTRWASDASCTVEWLAAEELADWVQRTGCACVTVTGGEPLLHEGTLPLLQALLAIAHLRVEVETNGAVAVEPVARLRNALPGSAAQRLCLTMDCKCPSSGCAEGMVWENFGLLEAQDAVKFVVGCADDLDYAHRVIREQGLQRACNVFFSPVFGSIEPAAIAEYIQDNRLAHVRLQLQLHKLLWPGQEKGV